MTGSTHPSPRLARLLMSLALRGEPREVIMGDLEEEFLTHISPNLDSRKARAWYWRQAMGSIAVAGRRSQGPKQPRRGWVSHVIRSIVAFVHTGRRLVTGLLHDIRYATRALRADKAVSALAVLMLALGIGATTAIFSLANWMMFRPVPGVRNPGELAEVRFAVRVESGGFSSRSVSYPNFRDLVRGVPNFAGFAGYERRQLHAATGGAFARRVDSEHVTANYFDVLGVRPTMGRFFRPEDDMPGARVAVISERFWSTEYGHNPDVIGEALRLNGLVFSVIGVAPTGFHGTRRFGGTEVWYPGMAFPAVNRSPSDYTYESRDAGAYNTTVARLRAGATFAQAEDQLQAATLGLAEAYPEVNKGFVEPAAMLSPGIGLGPGGGERMRANLNLLAGAVALVLLIACANAANLLLFRGVRRRGQSAVRCALGASRGRIVREQLIESVMLALLGGVGGIVFALLLASLFEGMAFAGVTSALDGVEVDARVLGFAVFCSVVVGVVFGTLPAVAAARVDFATALKDSARTETGRTPRVRSGLAVVQIAASVSLLVGALLFVDTLRNLNGVDLGFDPSGVTAFTVNPDYQGYSPIEMQAYYSELLRRAGELEAVRSASISYLSPFTWSRSDRAYPAGADPEVAAVQVPNNAVTSEYFSVLGIDILRGRGFRDSEIFAQSGQRPVILSESLARQFFGDVNPVGRYITSSHYPFPSSDHLVIGVAQDSRWTSLREEVGPMLYHPLVEEYIQRGTAMLLVRSPEPQALVASEIREIAAGLDSSLPLYGVEGMVERVAQRKSEELLFAKTLGLVALIAVLLAAVGLYGLVAFGVAERTREFGIRLALGADGARILKLVMRQAAVLAAAGVALGIVGAIVLTRFIESRLFGTSPLDPLVYLTAAGVLGLVTLLASYRPARTATNVEPVVALRYE